VNPGGSECECLVDELLQAGYIRTYPSPSLTAHGLYRLTDRGIAAAKEEESTLNKDRSVEEMANEVLMRQAKARADRTGESIEEAMETILSSEAGTQLRELRDAPHDEESVEEWQVGMARERAEERAKDLGDHLEEPPEHPTHG
jgi:DNA-binding MarR family transcriptional regulator